MEKPDLMKELRQIGLKPSRIKTTVHYMYRFKFDMPRLVDMLFTRWSAPLAQDAA